MNRPKIAILAHFPLSYLQSEGSEPKGYHCVWLIVLHHLLRSIPDYDFHWIVPDKGIRTASVVEFSNQTFHLLPKARSTVGLYTAYAYDRWQIRKVLKKLQPDLLHAWGTEDCYGLAASSFSGKKILSIQGLLVAYAQRARLARFERHQGALYEAYTLKRFSHITTESPWAADRVRELNPLAQVRCWEYAIPASFYEMERQPSTEPCCIMAGSNTPVKNVSCAIRAFSRPEVSHVKLYIAGVKPGDYAGLPDNIIPLGFIPHEEMAQKLSTSWCLVHPSLADSCPNIVKEARVMGIPAIVTHDCGAKQYVIDGKSGFVIKPNDDEALAKAVLSVTQSIQRSLEMGEFDRARCRDAISQPTMLRGIKELYTSILEA